MDQRHFYKNPDLAALYAYNRERGEAFYRGDLFDKAVEAIYFRVACDAPYDAHDVMNQAVAWLEQVEAEQGVDFEVRPFEDISALFAEEGELEKSNDGAKGGPPGKGRGGRF